MRSLRLLSATAILFAVGTVPSVASSVRARSLWDDPAFAAYRQAVEAYEAQDFDRVQRLTTEAIAAYPDHLLAYYLRGQVALAQKRWPDAADAFRKVTALYPGSFAAQRDLGVALQQAGRIDDAARAYETVLTLKPDHEDARAGWPSCS
jgi:predicted Zn-dependent protease